MNGRSNGPGRVAELMRKEFRQIFREPKLRRLIIVAPIIQLVVFGYAVSTDVRNVSTYLVDYDRSALSRELTETLTSSGYFRITGSGTDPDHLTRALDHGDASMGIVIPPGFQRDARGGKSATVQLLFDGTNSNIATIAKGYAERIVTEFALEQRAEGGSRPPVDLRERAWFNPELESRNYNVPAVMGAIIMLMCLLLTSLAIVREREIGTLEQLMVSPLQPVELVIGKTIPFALIGLFDLFLVTVIGIFWFDIPFRGNFFLLLLASVLYLLSGLGVGLLISTMSSTQQEAFMSSFLVFMPMILLSGFMFPVSSMPKVFQWITIINPMRHYLDIVRGTFLKGAAFGHLWPQYLALTIIGVSVLAFAAGRFEKRVV